tara:strand:+ start:980 stop:1489 length:510 start_codon:yes stop_codon:yes gene_type:complete
MSKIKIQKNFLSKEDLKTALNLFKGSYFPWYARDYQAHQEKPLKGEHLFCHICMDDEKIRSEHFQDLIIPFALKISMNKLFRARLNLLVNQNEVKKSAWHTDVEKTKNKMTSVFYYNTNNGGTEFKKEGFIKSEANTLITFPASLQHRSVQQTDTTFRYVLNLNYDLRK